MGDTKRMKRRKARLWEEHNGCCFWCGKQTILGGRRGGRVSKLYATIDHLRSRYHPLRHEPIAASCEPRTVLACYGCNNKRAIEEDKMIPIEERRRRAGRRGRWWVRWWRVIGLWLEARIEPL